MFLEELLKFKEKINFQVKYKSSTRYLIQQTPCRFIS